MNDGFCSTQETKTVNSSKILSIIKKSFSQRVCGDACDDAGGACGDGDDGAGLRALPKFAERLRVDVEGGEAHGNVQPRCVAEE